MKENRDEALLLFVKYPEAGKVKTRLARALGAELTLRLYRCFVEDLVDRLAPLPHSLRICIDPESRINDFMNWLGDRYPYIVQDGQDLGERMRNAFESIFSEGYSRAVVIGSDSPDLSEAMLTEAFRRLETLDVVIGPSLDGGYYLLGMQNRSFRQDIWSDVPWSTSGVLSKTRDNLRKNGIEPFLLQEWGDVDTFQDLKRLYRKNRNQDFCQSKTIKCLDQHSGILGL